MSKNPADRFRDLLLNFQFTGFQSLLYTYLLGWHPIVGVPLSRTRIACVK